MTRTMITETFKNIVFKAIYVCLLFSAFLYYFGKPSVDKYLQDKNFIEVSYITPENVKIPSLTICVDESQGWKNTSLNFPFFKTVCSNRSDEALFKCIDAETYSVAEIVKREVF